MKLLILADIHANLSAFDAVIRDAGQYQPEAALCLGDYVDYGVRPNEVIARMKQFPWPWLAILCGNHERAILTEDFSGFSTQRGILMAQYTKSCLSTESEKFLRQIGLSGRMTLHLDGKKLLLVHGSLPDPFWGKIAHGESGVQYSAFDVVFSGHTHRPHLFETYYPCAQSRFRGEKKTLFLNPGAVGQPRNHNPMAQYMIFDTENCQTVFAAAPYPVEEEQSIYPKELPSFYSERLALGI